MNKQRQKQINFFRSILLASKGAKTKELFKGTKYKEIVIRIPVEALEEIREWSETDGNIEE